MSIAYDSDDESVASDKSRLQVARAKGESKSEALEVKLPLDSQQDEEDAVEVTISSNLNPDEDKVPEEAATDGDEGSCVAAEAKDVDASTPAYDIATISSTAVDCNDENQAATNDTRKVCDEPISTAQKIVDDAVEEAVNSCT